jgi:type IV pilus assembly protein PilO
MKFGIRELLFLAVMIGTVTASFFSLKRSIAHREALQAETESWKRQLAALNQSGSDNVDWNKKIADLKDAIKFLEGKLPAEKEIDVILTQVENMVKANALEKKMVKPLKIDRSANYNELPIEMSLSGDFNGFYAFLQQLEKMPRITRLTNMALTKITDRDGAMQARITLSIFFEPDGGSKVASSN